MQGEDGGTGPDFMLFPKDTLCSLRTMVAQTLSGLKDQWPSTANVAMCCTATAEGFYAVPFLGGGLTRCQQYIAVIKSRQSLVGRGPRAPGSDTVVTYLSAARCEVYQRVFYIISHVTL